MASLMLFLLLLHSAHTYRASRQASCDAHPQLVPATQAQHCPDPPCSTTTEAAVSLALPVLLSMEHPRRAKDGGSTWGMILLLLDDTGLGRGDMVVAWEEELDQLSLHGLTCGSQESYTTLPVALQPGDSWLHLQVEAAGREVTLSHLKAAEKITAMTLTFLGDPPSVVAVIPLTRASQCHCPPCSTTAHTVTLALPVLLSTIHPRLAGWECEWGMKLNLLHVTKELRGVVTVEWNVKKRELVLWSWTLGGRGMNNIVPVAFFPEEFWLHLQVEVEGQQVILSLLNTSGKDKVMTLTVHGTPPSSIEVSHCNTLGYSATRRVIPTGCQHNDRHSNKGTVWSTLWKVVSTMGKGFFTNLMCPCRW